MSEALGSTDTPLPDAVDVAIVGGGIMGLSIAYHLATTSALRIAVIERSYLVSGASGRNGGGIRMQWSDADNVMLMMESIEICRGLAQELGINTWFRQGGYLFLARTPEAEARLQESVAVQRSVGAPTELVGPDEAREIVPALHTDDVRLAAYNPRDGVVFPWAFVWGYADRAARHGVAIRTHTAVTHVDVVQRGFVLTLADGSRLAAERVVNATGAWSVGLNRRLGIDLPNHPHRHEILSSEPLKPFLDPLVVDLTEGLYFSQSTRGELVAGITMPDAGPSSSEAGLDVDTGHSLRFLRRLARVLTHVLPDARALKVLRQWSGPYDVSPDGDAIVGPSPGLPGFVQVCGFTGHGFMMAPAVGRIVARLLALGEHHPMLDRWRPDRFAGGATTRAENMIIG